MSVPMMHTHFFPEDKPAEAGFGCICEYDRENYCDEEGRDPFEQEAIWKKSRAQKHLEENRHLWDSVEVLEYKDCKPGFKNQYVYKQLPYDKIQEMRSEFARKQRRWVDQEEQKQYKQDDPQKKLYCIVEAITPKPGFEERAEKLFKEGEKELEESYGKYLPEALVKTPPTLGKLVIKSKNGKAVFDFYPSEDLKAWSIPELLDPKTSKVPLPAGERSRAHMAGVIEAQEHRAGVLYKDNLVKCGWSLGRALTNEHIRPAYWSKEHVFWMPVEIVVDDAASGPEIVAYRNFLRADKYLTQSVQAVLSRFNKGYDDHPWSSRDIDSTAHWSHIRILFLRYLRHHAIQWNVVLPEPAPSKGLITRARESPAFNGTNIVIFTLLMAVLGLAFMLAYLSILKGVRIL